MAMYANLIALGLKIVQLAPAFFGLLGALYALTTGLSLLVAAIVKQFPGLADGKLDHFGRLTASFGADILKALTALKALYARFKGLDASQTAKVLIIAMVGLAAAFPGHSWAGPDISAGPSIPVVRVRLADPTTGKPSVDSLSAGAGYQLTVGWLPTELFGRAWDLFSVGGVVIGQFGQQSSGSVAGLVCTMQSFLCAGFGIDLLDSFNGELGGALAGRVGRQQLFGLLALNFNFALAPTAPPIGVARGAEGLVRGNTLYFSP